MTQPRFQNQKTIPFGPLEKRRETGIRRTLALVLFVLLFTVSAQANVKQEVDSLFTAGEFEMVELVMLRLGNNQGELTDEEFASVKTTAGFAMIMLDRESDARNYFREALEIDPELTLDPITVSPKFRVVFDEVKTSMQAEKLQPDRTIYKGARPGSMLMNLVLPGAGLLREGNLRGVVYLGAQAVTLFLLIDQLDKTSDSRAFYLAQTERGAIARAYNDYDEDYKTSWKYGVLCGVVYLAAQTDLALFRRSLDEDENDLTFLMLPTAGGLRLQVTW